MRVVTPLEMNNIDRIMSEKYSMPVTLLMENAGAAIAFHIAKEYPQAGKIVFVTGSGNNGGDGWAAARMLFSQGFDIEVMSIPPESKMRDAVKANYNIAKSFGMKYSLEISPDELRTALFDAEIIVDCIAGTGLHGGLNEDTLRFVRIMNSSAKTIISVDVPSGVDASTGAVYSDAVKAETLIVLGALKEGLLFYPARVCFCRTVVYPISIPDVVYGDNTSFKAVFNDSEMKSVIHRRKPSAHKGDFGRLGIIAGSLGMTGAACLCANAAEKTGAGLISLAVPESLNAIFEEKLTEQMTYPVPETASKAIKASKELYSFCDNKDAVIIGPGLSRASEGSIFIPELLKTSSAKFVIDADGLNCIVGNTECLRSAEGRVVITPHIGEMSRLSGKSIEEIIANQKEVALDFAEKHNVTVVLKSYVTVIASPDGRVVFNTTGNQGMATGGSGDVLSGIIGSLLAQGYSPFEAGSIGAYINGRAGEFAAEKFGEISLTPSDTVNSISDFLKQIR